MDSVVTVGADAELCRRVAAVIDRLVQLMDATDGWCYDTYDVRVGRDYQWLARHRGSRVARYGLYALYAIELLGPVTYRRLRGIPKTWDPMGNSYRAGIELALYCNSGSPNRLVRAQALLDRICRCAVGDPGKRGFALGFPCVTGSNILWSTRVPVAHYTLRVLRKLLMWERVVGDGRYRSVIREAKQFLLEGLPWSERDGLTGVAYTPADPLHVINIWADVASTLVSCHVMDPDADARRRAVSLFQSVLAHQMEDGSWPYFARWEPAAGPKDNTHTAMVLGAIADMAIACPELRPAAREALQRGVPCWLEMFFDERTGRHWNLVDRKDSVFTVCLGDALYAVQRLARSEVGLGPAIVDRLLQFEKHVIEWSLDNLLLRNGHFCERRLPYRSYSLGSIRSFDGLTGDALALCLHAHTGQSRERLWAL